MESDDSDKDRFDNNISNLSVYPGPACRKQFLASGNLDPVLVHEYIHVSERWLCGFGVFKIETDRVNRNSDLDETIRVE
jgi:hypothetical protein